MEIFVDSDVVISSLLSNLGAAYILLHTESVIPIISSLSIKELEVVVDRLGIDKENFVKLTEERLKVVPLLVSRDDTKKIFQKYVLDSNDGHIVAGAKESKVRFLITYNLKDYKIERIKDDFSIIILTPGQFLQYLRSLK